MHKKATKSKLRKKPTQNSNNPVPYWREKPFLDKDYEVLPHFISFFKASARGEKLSYSRLKENFSAHSLDNINLSAEDIGTLVNIARDEKLKGSSFQENALSAIGHFKPTNPQIIQKLVPLFNAASENDEEDEGESNYAFDNSWGISIEIL